MISGLENKIFLSSVDRENIEQLRQWRNKPEFRLYFRNIKEILKEQQELWFQEIILNKETQTNFEIHDAETCKLIGFCSLSTLDWVNRSAEFSIYIGDENYLSKGYAKDALRTLVYYGFFSLNLNRIWGQVFDTNKRALNAFSKAGFKQEGILRKSFYRNGDYIDSHIVSILKSEF